MGGCETLSGHCLHVIRAALLFAIRCSPCVADSQTFVGCFLPHPDTGAMILPFFLKSLKMKKPLKNEV